MTTETTELARQVIAWAASEHIPMLDWWGTGAKERRFIHIEPYWRGPEDAPIAVRPHVLGGAA